MSSWLQDGRYALRTLASRPVYSLVTVLVLVVAIGANTAMFSMLNAFVLQPLPYPAADRLVDIHNTYPNMGLDDAWVSVPDYLDRREQAPSLEESAIYNFEQRLLTGIERPEQLLATRTTPSLFGVLGIDAALGRAFTEAEGTLGNDRVVVLSHALWSNRFGASSTIVGSDIRLDDEAFRVVGVMPEGFSFPNPNVDIWIPFAFTPEQMSDAERGSEYSRSIGRLAEGATIAGLNAEIDAIVQRSLDLLPRRRAFIESSGFTGIATPLHEFMVADISGLLYLLQGLVLAVLLIACANVANLQLARAAGRRRELSVRAALGASRARLARLMLLESFALAALGAVGGLLVCFGLLEAFRTFELGAVGIGFDFTIDLTVLLFTLASALVATIVTGLFPLAAMLRDDVVRGVQEGSRVAGGRAAQRFRSGLVVFQIGASVALLVSAGLLAKSFYNLADENPGFDATNVWTARVVLPRARYPDAESALQFNERMLEALGALPGVAEAGWTSVLPFSGMGSQGNYAIDGYTPPDSESPPHAHQRSINEQYFPSLGIPVVMGRNFARDEGDRVAIVDELLVREFFPDGDVLGQRLARGPIADREWFTIVGVVPAVHQDTLAAAPSNETVYWHYRQQPAGGGGFVTLRSTLPPEQLGGVVTDAVRQLDSDVLLADVLTMDARLVRSLGSQSAAMVLTIAFAIGALLLAIIGVYGVLTWAVTQRTGEIGIRMALGANPGDVVRMVLGQGGRLIGTGLLVGVSLALLLAAAMSSQTFGVSAVDPGVYAAAIAAIVLAAVGASWLPARRASAVDPMQALRDQ